MGGDITFRESDLMGTASDKQTFSSIDIRRASGTWVFNDPKLQTDWTPSGTAVLCFMHMGVPAQNYFQIWTYPLDHAC
jgi:hypothetical protein